MRVQICLILPSRKYICLTRNGPLTYISDYQQKKNVKPYTVDDQTYQDKGIWMKICSQSFYLWSGNKMVVMKPKLISIPDYAYKNLFKKQHRRYN